MKFKIEKIERFESEMFIWFEAQLSLTDGTALQAFFDIGDGDFRLFHAERLTWPERDDIRSRIMAVFHAMLSTEAEKQS